MSNERRIAYVLNNFDFDRVADTMEALKWRWRDAAKSPTVLELRAEAEKLLRLATKRGSAGCGGFEATYLNPGYELQFVVYSSDDEFYKDDKDGDV